MHEAAAVSALALTLGLALRRPTLASGFRIGPAPAAGLGVAVLALTGDLHWGDVEEAFGVLWRPLLTLASIMVLTGVAGRVGVFGQLTAVVLPRAGESAARLFGLVFGLSLATAAVLNNDAAILVLTPVVVLAVRQLYPDTPELLLPFVFAVFMAAGVAPFVTSNPMNTVVAGVAGIDFNEYATTMLPVAAAGSIVTYLVLRRVFAAELTAAPAPRSPRHGTPWTDSQRQALALVLVVLAAYPVFALVGQEVYAVALVGAVLALGLSWAHRAGHPADVLKTAVAWEILVFLIGMFLLAQGLQNVGVVDRLSDLYESTGRAFIGVTSAVGSALINNHSMALTNLLAIENQPGAGHDEYFAALVGGDLGPRLLPIGSLAGLLWLTLLGRMGVEVPLRRFVTVGAAVTIPSLAVSLAVLELV